ncbi:DUF5615 family PIN-like protein [uncultured Mucilaginibacter sp.]|uniref:DUF5615 family PIN-like protein n=1 Tax=uncultured Mucilaginibacter sp. TaxID=797541 RepID=UPI00262525D9|nr:DUF5615 family PIN-like protein [uncultured Mucilaginibacter sp.]
MTIWIDAQISPAIAAFVNRNFTGVEAKSVRSLNLLNSDDVEIFMKARAENAIIMSKDVDFLNLLEQFGVPPQIIWITCGNTSNTYMCNILQLALEQALQILTAGEPMVEISNMIK